MKIKLRGLLIVIICICMCAVSFNYKAYADTNDTVEGSVDYSSENENIENENGEPENNEDDKSDENEGDSSVGEQGSSIGSLSGSNEDSVSEVSQTSEKSETSEDSTDEDTMPNINVTGVFECNVIDNNGTVINSWFNDSDNSYYLFLTKACSISDITVNVDGVIIDTVSNGEIDQTTNSISGAFSAGGDRISVTDKEGNQYNIVVMQSDIPSVCITLNNTDLDTVNNNSKDIKYPGNSVVITNADGSVDLSYDNVELKGRGNTTWILSDKKGYQIKFNKKQKVLGMPKAKKWVLLANSFDDSMMHNCLAMNLADRIGMRFAPDFEYIDLWVNGKYRGNYIIGEKNEINSSRLDLSDNEGILFEEDSAFYSGEDIWFKTENTGEYFTVKESVSDNADDINAGIESFKSTYNELVKYICNTDRSLVTLSELGKYIDVESAAQYYLVTEYMANYESYYTSFFWYKDGENDVIHVGPVWDFDTSQGASSAMNPDSNYAGNNLVYRTLLQTPIFLDYVNNYYNEHIGAFSEIQNDIASIKAYINSSADMNYTRWNWLGKPNQKQGSKNFEATYDGAVQTLVNWHSARSSSFVPGTLDKRLYIENNSLMYNVADKGYTNVKAAIWHNSDMSDLKWISANRSDQGWTGGRALSSMPYQGLYNVHVYSYDAGGKPVSVIGTMTYYLNNEVNANVYADQVSDFEMSLRAENASSFSSVRFAVWSDINGQDDLKWYQGSRNQDMSWSADVDLKDHFGAGAYNIHAYSGDRFIGAAVCDVSLPKVSVNAEVKQDSNFVNAIIENSSYYDEIRVAIWGDPKGQNDLKWYTANLYDGVYKANIDIAAHNEIGTYNMHVYGKKGSTLEFIGATNFDIKAINRSELYCRLTESERVLYLSYSTSEKKYDSLRAAVWGDINGQNDLKWYDLNNNSAKISVVDHNEKGNFSLHLYGVKNGNYEFITAYNFNVDSISNPKLAVEKKGMYLNAQCKNAEDFSKVRFAVWNSDNGQDDLKWYNATYINGMWSCKANLSKHYGSGNVYVHAYGMKDGKLIYMDGSEISA